MPLRMDDWGLHEGGEVASDNMESPKLPSGDTCEAGRSVVRHFISGPGSVGPHSGSDLSSVCTCLNAHSSS